jgi:transcriptional regulator with XRE-family HTH domain
MDVAAAAGVSASLVSMLERGHVGRVTLDVLRNVAAALELRIDVVARWRGGELDRLLSARHAALTEAVASWLVSLGWEVAPEVSFAYYGERGSIDLLCWHAPSRTLLVVEIKTELVDVQEMVGTLDRKSRLAPRIARDRRWIALSVARLVVMAEGPTNRRRVSGHATLIRAAFPDDGRAARKWLRNPGARFSGLTFFSNSIQGCAKSGFSARKRVRVPSARCSDRGPRR